jgi:hypothetical protein
MSGTPCATSLSLRASSLNRQDWLRQPLAQLTESPALSRSGGCNNAQLHVCSLVQPHYYRTTRRLPWVRASGRVSLFVSRTFHDAAKRYRTAPAGLCAVRHRVFAPASPRFPTSPPDPNRRRVTNDSNTQHTRSAPTPTTRARGRCSFNSQPSFQSVQLAPDIRPVQSLHQLLAG